MKLGQIVPCPHCGTETQVYIGGKAKARERRMPMPPESATSRQMDYILGLGGAIPEHLTKAEASAIIDQLKDHSRASQRQMMVLRFWDRLDMAAEHRTTITAWMDEFYTTNPLRKSAWEYFKKDFHDDGSQRDASWVPLGAGYGYLKKIKRNRIIAAAVVLFVLLLLWLIIRALISH